MYASDLAHCNPDLESKLGQLYALNRDKTIDLGFRPPYLSLLEKFGNPHENLPPVIHVAGTNGKGSVIAFMRAMLEAAGYRVHVYTSPHLVQFNERIVLAGEMITDEQLEPLIDEALALNNGGDVTFFEITTALAFAAFARTPADILLLETGLGGRLDCTNLIEQPLLSVINTIGYDHMEFLGESLVDIAGEKAGIIKASRPCILGSQKHSQFPKDIISIVKQVSNKKHADLYRYGAQWYVEPENGHIRFIFDGVEDIYPLPAMVGAHQVDNAGLALAAMHVISREGGVTVDHKHCADGIQKAFWPARLQKLSDGKPGHRPEIWLDGGHNVDAAAILAAQMNVWREESPTPIHLVLGMMAHKAPLDFLEPLLPYLAGITVVDIPGEPKSLKAGQLQAMIAGAGWQDAPQILSCGDVFDALGDLENNMPDGRILIAGSLYLAGHVLKNYRGGAHTESINGV